MGSKCSCFKFDNPNYNVEFTENKSVIPNTEKPQSPVMIEISDRPTILDSLDLKSVSRRYLTRKAYSSFLSPAIPYIPVDLSMDELQPTQISAVEKSLNLPSLPFPVYKINDEYYQGPFNRKLQKHGLGTLLLADLRKYTGFFSNNHMQGSGLLIFSNSDYYQGEFSKSKAHGAGTYTHANGSSYTGQFKKDKQHGHGKETWSNGCEYTGNYRRGKKHGKGHLVFPNGISYTGDFCSNRIEGKGTYRWSSEKWYEGEMVDSQMHGYGELHSNSGLVYKGWFVNDAKEGHGVCTWPDGRVYEGGWKAGVQHGNGTFKFFDSSQRLVEKQGVWVNGKRTKWV